MTENVKVADAILRDNPRRIGRAREQGVHVSGGGVSLVGDSVRREGVEVRGRVVEGEVDELFSVEKIVLNVDPIPISTCREELSILTFSVIRWIPLPKAFRASAPEGVDALAKPLAGGG